MKIMLWDHRRMVHDWVSTTAHNRQRWVYILWEVWTSWAPISYVSFCSCSEYKISMFVSTKINGKHEAMVGWFSGQREQDSARLRAGTSDKRIMMLGTTRAFSLQSVLLERSRFQNIILHCYKTGSAIRCDSSGLSLDSTNCWYMSETLLQT
jgi:hypothetical protein